MIFCRDTSRLRCTVSAGCPAEKNNNVGLGYAQKNRDKKTNVLEYFDIIFQCILAFMNVVGQRRRIFFLRCSLKIYTALSSILRDYFVVAKCTVDPPTNAAIGPSPARRCVRRHQRIPQLAHSLVTLQLDTPLYRAQPRTIVKRCVSSNDGRKVIVLCTCVEWILFSC